MALNNRLKVIFKVFFGQVTAQTSLIAELADERVIMAPLKPSFSSHREKLTILPSGSFHTANTKAERLKFRIQRASERLEIYQMWSTTA